MVLRCLLELLRRINQNQFQLFGQRHQNQLGQQLSTNQVWINIVKLNWLHLAFGLAGDLESVDLNEIDITPVGHDPDTCCAVSKFDAWRVSHHDLNKGIDLLSSGYVPVMETAMRQGYIGCLHLATECRTYSRANTGSPYRTAKWPRGVPWLKGERLLRCQKGNALLALSIKLFIMALNLGLMVWLENPQCSKLWDDELVRPLLVEAMDHDQKTNPRLIAITVHYCAYGRPFRTATRLLCGMLPSRNAKSLSWMRDQMATRCKHK